MADFPCVHSVDMSDTTEKVIGNFGGKTLYGQYISADNIALVNSGTRDTASYLMSSDVKGVVSIEGYFKIIQADIASLVGQKRTFGSMNVDASLLFNIATSSLYVEGSGNYIQFIANSGLGIKKVNLRAYVKYIKEEA